MRVGLIGAGWVTQYHLPAWARVAGAEVVAICDPDSAAAAARADEYGIAARHANLADILAAGGIDAVDICSPRQFHAEHVRQAAAAGLPILCQKPLGVDLAEAEALVAGLPAGTVLMVHENWRFRPYYRLLRDWLAEGVIGDLRAARLDFHSSGMIPDAAGQRPALVRQPFFRSLDRLLVAEVLIHHLDTLRYLLGELDLDAARLMQSNADIRAEDVALLRLTRRVDGMPVDLSGNLAVHGAPPAPADHLTIWGAKGAIRLTGTVLHLDGPAPRRVEFDPAASYQAAYDGAIAHFAGQLRGARDFETAAPDNLLTLRLVEAAYRQQNPAQARIGATPPETKADHA